MRTTTPIIATLLLGASLFLLPFMAGCTDNSAGPKPRSTADRLTALEVQMDTFRKEAAERETALRKELAQVRTNLEHIRKLLELRKETEAVEPSTSDDTIGKTLDDTRKSLEKSLERLSDVTKKLLDKMEKEIDEQLEKLTPAPEGEEI